MIYCDNWWFSVSSHIKLKNQNRLIDKVQIFMVRQCLMLIQMGTNMAAGKPTQKFVTEFCQKSVNLSLEELKNLKIILFLTHELFRQPQIPRNKSQLFRPSCKCYSLSQNQEPIHSENLYEYQFSTAVIHHESKILGGLIVQYTTFGCRGPRDE